MLSLTSSQYYVFGLMLWLSSLGNANSSDLSQLAQPTTQDPSPHLGQVLDNKNQPIPAQPKVNVGLEFLEQDLPLPSTTKTSRSQEKKNTTKVFKKQSRTSKAAPKKSIPSRKHIANDPSCRWLDARMDHLEDQLRSPHTQTLGHHKTELSNRKKEWQCLNCAAQGPIQGDHSRCQHRR